MNEHRSPVITGYCSNQAGFEREGTLSFGQLIKITHKCGWVYKSGTHFRSFVSCRNLCLCQRNWSQMAKQSSLSGLLREWSHKTEPLALLHKLTARNIFLFPQGAWAVTIKGEGKSCCKFQSCRRRTWILQFPNCTFCFLAPSAKAEQLNWLWDGWPPLLLAAQISLKHSWEKQ